MTRLPLELCQECGGHKPSHQWTCSELLKPLGADLRKFVQDRLDAVTIERDQYKAERDAALLQISDLKATSCSIRHADDLAEERDQLKLQVRDMEPVVEAAIKLVRFLPQSVEFADAGQVLCQAINTYEDKRQAEKRKGEDAGPGHKCDVCGLLKQDTFETCRDCYMQE